MNKCIRALLGGVSSAVLIAALAQSAAAQTAPGSPGAPAVRPERPDTRSPAASAAENYDPKGVPLGSFKLFPELELGEVYNDNIYATNFGVAGRTASFIQLIKPSLTLRSDWNQHMLNLFAKGNIGLFTASNNPNFTDFSVGTDGRYDIQRDWNVYAGASFNHNHEDPGTPNAAVGAVPPNVYDQIAGNVGYFQKFNRLSMRADGRVDNYNYTNNLTSVNGSLANYFRDRTEWRETLRAGYEIVGDTQVWVRGGMNQRVYLYTPDQSGINRNSKGFDIVAGLQIDFGGITSVEVFAGYLQQNYADGNSKQVSAPTFGLTGFWNPIREVSVRPFIQRTVNDAGITSSAAYLSTSGGLDVDYKVRPNVKLSAHGDYSVADYSVVSQSTNEYDQYLTLRASAMYSPNNIFYVGPSYQYVYKTSNLPNANYDQSIVMLRLGAHL
jgi:hypothetical protein